MTNTQELRFGARRIGASIFMLTAALMLGACGSSDGPAGSGGGTTSGGTSGGTTGGTGSDSTTPDLYVSFDAGGDNGSADTYPPNLSTRLRSFNTGLNENILTRGTDLLAVGVRGGVATYRRFANFATRTDTAFDPTVDTEATYAAMRAPKGITLAGLTGNLFVIGDSSTVTAGEDPTTVPSLHVLTNLVAPQAPTLIATIPVSVATARTWDTAYQASADRLYAAMTNGTVAVYDTFATRAALQALPLGAVVTPSRFITPGAINGGVSSKISTNLHGIAYDSGTDTLVVSDIGSATDNTDGAIYSIANASTASDTAVGGGAAVVVPSKIVSGSNTRLGNPVDILLRANFGNALYVAEKGNSRILIFSDFLTAAGGNVAPMVAASTGSAGSTGTPESITFVSGR